MNDANIANIRTGFTAAWTGINIYIAAKLGWEIDPTDPTVIPIIGAAGAVVWRASETLAQVPYLGYILFGVNKTPGYKDSPPVNPEVPTPVPEG